MGWSNRSKTFWLLGTNIGQHLFKQSGHTGCALGSRCRPQGELDVAQDAPQPEGEDPTGA